MEGTALHGSDGQGRLEMTVMKVEGDDAYDGVLDDVRSIVGGVRGVDEG